MLESFLAALQGRNASPGTECGVKTEGSGGATPAAEPGKPREMGVRTRMERALGGFSSVLRDAYREARDSMSIANELGDQETTTFYGDLKLYQFLLSIKEKNLDHLRRFYEESLQPLVEHDRQKQGDLVRTLNGFFDAWLLSTVWPAKTEAKEAAPDEKPVVKKAAAKPEATKKPAAKASAKEEVKSEPTASDQTDTPKKPSTKKGAPAKGAAKKES